MNRWAISLAVAVFICFSAAVGAERPKGFEKDQKAFYLSEKEQGFIRPGLSFEILDAFAESDGTVRFRFRIGDRAGAPLDINGVATPGAVSVRPVLARIPQGENQHRAYTARMATSRLTGMTAEQADRDRSGTIEKVGEGEYVYTFGTKLPDGYDQAATHTVAAWALRDLEEFDLGEFEGADTFDWVPAGSELEERPPVVRDESCNACHGKLSAHDNRTTVALCVTCHTLQSTDPDTGNTVDFATMVHKIHRGADLPSVLAGEPYQIIGFRNSVHDYSTVEYPADVRNCKTCHIENIPAVAAAKASLRRASSPRRSRASSLRTAALTEEPVSKLHGSEENQHLLEPSMRACGSCHDDVNFATGENHASLPQISDNQCTRCHTPQGELEFDISILGSHTVERASQELPGTNFEILDVTDTGAGQTPTVSFSITNDAGEPVEPTSMGRLALVLAGNAKDFSEFYSENARVAQGSGGRFFYTFQQAIPEAASGTWAVGIEGYQNAMILPGTLQERSVRDAGDNQVFYFSVDGAPAVPRRQVISQQKCNSCHFDLDLHGSNRNAVEHCVLCHNPATTDVARRPAEAGAPESVNFKNMIHRIHAGEDQERDYTVYGFGGSRHNYNEVRYPNSLADCAACHVNGSEDLPLEVGLLSAVAPRDRINPSPPATGACVSCHTALSSAAHADLNTSSTFGESCDVCHGPNAEFSVSRTHAR